MNVNKERGRRAAQILRSIQEEGEQRAVEKQKLYQENDRKHNMQNKYQVSDRYKQKGSIIRSTTQPILPRRSPAITKFEANTTSKWKPKRKRTTSRQQQREYFG
eukprot:1771462-Amphidinium_carterae.2